MLNKSSAKRIAKRHLSNSFKNSTLQLSSTRRMSSPSPSKKRKISKRKIKKRKFSSMSNTGFSGKSSKLKRTKQINPSDTSPFPLMINQFTPLVNQNAENNMHVYTQKFRTDKHDLHDAQAKIHSLQKILNKSKSENHQVREKYKRMHTILDNTALRNRILYQECKNLCQRIIDIAQEYRSNTESIQSIDNLIDSQEWLIESYIQATKEFKRYIAQQDQDFRADIEKSQT